MKEVGRYYFKNAVIRGGQIFDDPVERVFIEVERDDELMQLQLTVSEAVAIADLLLRSVLNRQMDAPKVVHEEAHFIGKIFKGITKGVKGLVKGVGKVAKSFFKNPLQALIKSPLKVGLPVLGGALLLSQLGKRKKVKPQVPEHLQPLQQLGGQLGQELLQYGQAALTGVPTELGVAGMQTGLGVAGGQTLPILGALLGGVATGAGLTGLRGLGTFTQPLSPFASPEYGALFGELAQQAARTMRETVSPILSQMQAMGLGESSAAISQLAQAQERIMEDYQRQLAQIAAQAFEAERQRQLAAASQLAGMLPTGYALPEAGVMGGLQALGVGLQAAGMPRAIAQSILGMSPLSQALLYQGAYPLYRPSTLEQILSAGGQAAAIYDILRGG